MKKQKQIIQDRNQNIKEPNEKNVRVLQFFSKWSYDNFLNLNRITNGLINFLDVQCVTVWVGSWYIRDTGYA